MGEEWGASTPFQYFTAHDDPGLGRAVSEGRRREFEAFGWDPEDVPDPQDEHTFTASKLDWSEPGHSPHAEVLEWYRSLIALRRALPPLRDGRAPGTEVAWSEEARYAVVERGPVTVACNLAAEKRVVPVDPERRGELLLFSGSGADPAPRPGGVELGPHGVSIWHA
jgi:maltooligosyltrehalose trehalohydrolase